MQLISQLRILRASSWKATSSFKKCTYFLVSQTIADYCRKSALFQTLMTFVLYIFNISKYTQIHKEESRIQLYYQLVAAVFWCWVMTAWKMDLENSDELSLSFRRWSPAINYISTPHSDEFSLSCRRSPAINYIVTPQTISLHQQYTVSS